MKNTKKEILRSTSLDKDFIYDCLERNKPRAKIFIIDCCYSGAFVKPAKSGNGENNVECIDIEKSVEDGKGCYILTASRPLKTVPAKEDHSVFTKVMLEGIETGKACKSADGRIYPDDLYNYIKENIEEGQHPVANFINLEGKAGMHLVTIKQSIGKALKKYNEIIAEDYSRINVIGNINQIVFNRKDIYIPLFISKDKNIIIACKSEMKDKYEAKDLLNIKNVNRIIVKGEPGMGKTTMLRYLMGEVSENDDDITPVYIKLSEFQDSNDSLISYIISTIKSICPNIERDMLLLAFEEGKILVLIGGLDEVKSNIYESVKKKIKEFSNNYRRCKIILTSRNYGFKFIDFTNYIFEIDSLPIKEIENYVSNFYNKCEVEEVAKIKINSLVSSIKLNDEIKKMAKNPFLLSILCLVGQKLDVLPKYRVELYKECVLLLLNRKSTMTKCKVRTKEKVLKEVAYRFFSIGDGYSEFDLDELEDFINEIIKCDGFDECKNCNAENCIESFCDESGIMKKFGYEKYGFSHRTFCEYYVSLKLKEMRFSEIIEKSSDRMWEEPIKLYSAQIKNKVDGKDLIERMWKTNRELALRCYPEMIRVIDKDLVKSLLGSVNVKERIKLIDGLEYIDDNGEEVSNV
jgi:Cdc6-like AAA superfamily ATPase